MNHIESKPKQPADQRSGGLTFTEIVIVLVILAGIALWAIRRVSVLG